MPPGILVGTPPRNRSRLTTGITAKNGFVVVLEGPPNLFRAGLAWFWFCFFKGWCSPALACEWFEGLTGLLSNQGEKSINFYFILVPLRKQY